MVSVVGWAALAAQESWKNYGFPCIVIVWAMGWGGACGPFDSLEIHRFRNFCMVSAVGWAALATQESLKIHEFSCIFIVWAMGWGGAGGP